MRRGRATLQLGLVEEERCRLVEGERRNQFMLLVLKKIFRRKVG